jgi:hypothetical protein
MLDGQTSLNENSASGLAIPGTNHPSFFGCFLSKFLSLIDALLT